MWRTAKEGRGPCRHLAARMSSNQASLMGTSTELVRLLVYLLACFGGWQALFLWMVRLINTSLGKGEDSLPFIGVLDIFGEPSFDFDECALRRHDEGGLRLFPLSYNCIYSKAPPSSPPPAYVKEAFFVRIILSMLLGLARMLFEPLAFRHVSAVVDVSGC